MICRKTQQYIFVTLLFLISIGTISSAQTPWPLTQCLTYALEHHPDATLANNSLRLAEINQSIQKKAQLPSVGFDSNAGLLFGRNIDPATNAFSSRPVFYNSFQLDVYMPLYANGKLKKSIQQAAFNSKASAFEKEQSRQDIQLNVFKAYMNVLFAGEQAAKARKNLSFAEEQLRQMRVLIASGAKARNEELDLLAQTAQYKQTVSEAENAIILQKIELAGTMYHSDYRQLTVQEPDNLLIENTTTASHKTEMLILEINRNSPALKANAYKARSGEMALELEETTRYPSINLFARLNSRYSSAGKRAGAFETVTASQEVLIDGDYTLLEVPQQVPILERNPYFKQLGENFGQQIGVSISAPIFDKGISKLNQEKIKVELSSNRLAKSQIEQQLASTTHQLIEQIRANRKNQELIQNRIVAIRSSFEKARQEFNLGAINSFDLFAVKKELDLAELELTKSQYELLFHTKMLAFFAGEELSL